jgi:hypothetical protein
MEDHPDHLAKGTLHRSGRAGKIGGVDRLDLQHRAHAHGPHGGQGPFEDRKNVFNGALTPMMQCLLEAGDLSEKDLAEIEALIKSKRKSPKGKP